MYTRQIDNGLYLYSFLNLTHGYRSISMFSVDHFMHLERLAWIYRTARGSVTVGATSSQKLN